MTVLIGHTSPDTAYVVNDYPYGFRLRTKIRYWIETNKHGSRVVSQTVNPKVPGEVWNKPKASTYSELRVLFIDDVTGHVMNDALSIYSDSVKVAAFETAYGEAFTERDHKVLRAMKAAHAAYEAREAARKAVV